MQAIKEKNKMKKIITILAIVSTLVVGVVIYTGINNDKLLDENASNDNETIQVENNKVLSCYDAINSLLEKDGFKYVSGTRWGRGEKNFFSFDLASREFRVAEYSALETVPDDWYENEYEKYVAYNYSYETKTLIHQQSIIHGNIYNQKEDDYTMYPDELNNTEILYYEIPGWMDYYISEFEKMGCSTTNDLDVLKNTASNYRGSNIISVFDVKSTDGVVRYYNDVHVEGNVKDHPRYREIQSFDEYLELKKAWGFESIYMLNIINTDTTKVFEKDSTPLQSNLLLGEFVKDVVYQFTPERNDERQVETIGVYFLDIDNPNGNFKSLYKAPTAGKYFEYPPDKFGKNLREFEMPFEATVVGFEKEDDVNYKFFPFSVFSVERVLEMYIADIKLFNEDVTFSEDFIRNYTRPYAYDWQKRMGLTKLFDEKYGLIDHDIQYVN